MPNPLANILVCEDDEVQREIIRDILTESGYAVEAAASAEDALSALDAESFDLLLTDLRMPGTSGLDLLPRAKHARPDLAVVIMTAYATVQTAVKAMKEGASDYLAKPFDKDELLLTIQTNLERVSLRRENAQLRAMLKTAYSYDHIVGPS